MANEIATVNNESKGLNRFDMDGFDIIADLTSAQTAFCSMTMETEEEKSAVFNAMNNPDERLADCINKQITIKDVYIEIVECTNTETGEVTSCPRVVIIDDKGKTYQCVSVGIYSALKKIFMIWGTPNNWEKPIKVEIKQVTKGERKMLTLVKA